MIVSSVGFVQVSLLAWHAAKDFVVFSFLGLPGKLTLSIFEDLESISKYVKKKIAIFICRLTVFSIRAGLWVPNK